MPDEIRARGPRGAPRGNILHSSGVVPRSTLQPFGVEHVHKFRPNFFEQILEVRRADPGAGEAIRRHGHDEVGKTCRYHFQRKMTATVLRFQAQRIKKGSFFVLAQHPPECRAALLHGDAVSSLPYAFRIETYLSGGKGENERSRVVP